jgi:amidase
MAPSGILRWLERDYKLSASEAAVVVGFAIKYDIVDLVGTQVSIAAKLPRSTLAKLRKASRGSGRVYPTRRGLLKR